jgi:transcriptional regulator with XRE-family HTH domain
MNAWRQIIETRMDERGLSIADLARRAGLSRQTLYSILSNDEDTIRDLPARKTLDALAAALELPADRLLLAAAQAYGVPVASPVLVQTVTDVPDSELARELLARALEREARRPALDVAVPGPGAAGDELDLSDLDGASVVALIDLRRTLQAQALSERAGRPGLAKTLDHLAGVVATALDAAAEKAR